MDGGKFFNRIQSGSFQHRSMAAALRVQHGPGWTATTLMAMGNTRELDLLDQFTTRRKRKHVKDSARKISLKYKKQRLDTRYGSSVVNSSDSSYGSLPAEPDVDQNELFRLCRERLERLHKSAREIEEISELTADQADDESGEWIMLRRERVTASSFGSIVKRRSSFTPLVSRLLYGKHCLTAAMKYGHYNESVAREAYIANQRDEHHRTVFVTKTGLHIDYLDNWMGASPDGLVLDTSDVDHPCGLLEIKCPARGETTSLIDLCTKAQYKPSTFFLQYRNGEFHLKRTHDYYYQVQGQLYITARPWCDFVVRTPNHISVERIWFDSVLWSNKMYPRLKQFYMNSILPELASPRHPAQPIRESVPFYVTGDGL